MAWHYVIYPLTLIKWYNNAKFVSNTDVQTPKNLWLHMNYRSTPGKTLPLTFSLDGDDYLLIVDYLLSLYFQVEKLPTTIPMKLVSNNASYYTSAEFRNFTEEWDINHVTIFPHV